MTQHSTSNLHSQSNHQNQSTQAQRQACPTYTHTSRRDYLLRRKLDLEMEAQDLLARLDSLDDEWIALQHRKAILRQQISSMKAQALLSGVFGVRQTAGERLFAFQVQWIMQEEVRIEQQKIHCSHQIQAVNAKLVLIDSEIDLLP